LTEHTQNAQLALLDGNPAQAKAGQSDASDAVFLTTSPMPISVPIPAGMAADGLSLMFLVRGGHPDAHQYRKSDRPLCGMMDSNLFGLLPDGGRLLWGVLPLKQDMLDSKKNVRAALTSV